MWNQGTRARVFPQNLRFDDRNYEGSFYRAVKPTLRIAKAFGLFPIKISSRNPRNIRFEWRSFRTLFSAIFLFGSVVSTLLLLKSQAALGPLTARNVGGVVFYGCCWVNCILFFKISQKFDVFMTQWATTESHFTVNEYELPTTAKPLRTRILVTTILYLLASLVEHLLFFATEANMLFQKIKFCKLTNYDFISAVIKKHLAFIFNNCPWSYNHLQGFFFEYLNVSFTFYWGFSDLFIILTSIGVSFLFEKLNSRVRQCRGLLVNETIWSDIRYHHAQTCELLRYINTLMGQTLVFASFIDGYFILIQLLNITISLPFFINKFYFWYSLIFLAGRATVTVLIASEIQAQSRYPLEVFRSIPTQGWSKELQRFFDQIRSEANALSGMDFFLVTRKLLLTMAGTLITYELVLLQFNSSDVDWEHLLNCNETLER